MLIAFFIGDCNPNVPNYQIRQWTIDETYIPEIVVSLTFRNWLLHNGDFYLKIFFCVQNIGTRAARKIRFAGDLSFAPVKGKSLNSIHFIENGSDALRPGEEVSDKIVANRGRWSEIFGDEVDKNRKSKAKIDVTYQNIRKRNYKDDFTLDFNATNAPDIQQANNRK